MPRAELPVLLHGGANCMVNLLIKGTGCRTSVQREQGAGQAYKMYPSEPCVFDAHCIQNGVESEEQLSSFREQGRLHPLVSIDNI
jgi:hypothetical protein